MASYDGHINIDTALDSKGLANGLSKLSGIAKGAIGAVTTIVGGAAAAFGTLAGVAVKTGNDFAQTASDLIEAQNVVSQTFQTSGDEVNRWAATMAASAGVSQTNATKFVGSMGAMLKSSGLTEAASRDMAESLVQLTGDMSSFYNLDHDETWAKIRAGIAGETEPLKQLGINMSVANLEAFALSKGIDRSFNSMTQAEQTTLRYQYLMKATADAQGDFARTSDGLANQTRLLSLNLDQLKTNIGAGFTGVVNGATTALNGLLGQINGLLADGFQDSDLTAVSGIVTSLIDQMAASLQTEAPKVLAAIQPLIGALVGTFTRLIPTLAPILINGGVQLITALVQGIASNLSSIMAAGGQIVQALGTGLSQLAPALGQIGNALLTQIETAIKAGGAEKMAAAAASALQNFIQGAGPVLSRVLTIGVLMVSQLVSGIGKALPQLIPAAVDAVMQLVETLTSAQSITSLLNAAIDLIMGLVNGIINALPRIIEAGPRVVQGLIQGIVGAIPKLIDAAINLLTSLAKYVINNLPLIIESGLKIVGSLIAGLVQAIPQLIIGVGKLLSALIDTIIHTNWLEVGVNIVKGIINGLFSMVSQLAQAAANLAKQIWGSITSWLGIHSPSVKMQFVGEMVDEGAIKGIEARMAAVRKSARGLAETVYSAAMGQQSALAARFGSSAVALCAYGPAIGSSGSSGGINLDELVDKLVRAGAVGGDVYIDGEKAGKILEPAVSRHQGAKYQAMKRSGYRGKP